MSVNGQKALVTGGSRGIGFEICKILLENGCEVIALSKNLENLTKAKLLLPDLIIFQADLEDPSQFEDISEYVSNKWGYLDTLINNAGISPKQGNELSIQPDEVFLRTIETNLTAPYLATKRLLPYLLQSKDPRIINIGSSMGIISPNLSGIYSVSKAALHALTIAFANELRGKVAINLLCPGWVKTNMAPNAPGNPRSSAEAVLSLLGKDKSFTGHILRGKSVYQ